MKKTIFVILSLLLTAGVYSQAPSGFNYQAVLHDISGNIRANASITVRIDLLQGSASGTMVYAESFATSTNTFGLVSLQIGKGTIISGTFSSINWGNGIYFIKVTIDGTEMGTSQLLSVPYALYAMSAANGFSGDYNDLKNRPTRIIENNVITGGTFSYNTTGWCNVAMGKLTLSNNTTGYANTAIGHRSLFDNISGFGNIAIGYEALTSNTTGFYNTSIGAYSLNSDTSGSYNTALGANSLHFNIDGNNNTAIGYFSLNKNTTGDYNTATGNGALLSNTTGNYNTAAGYYALSDNTTGNENVAFGNKTLESNTVGSFNTAFGTMALNKNTSGYGNTSVGSFSLSNNITGKWNTAIGDSALQKVNSDKNTAIGYKSLTMCTGWDNSAIGYRALIANTSGFDNTAIGTDAMILNTTGNGNTAIGKQSMNSHITGDNNTAIGFNANISDGITNSTAIGYNASVTSSNKIVLGNASATTVGGFGSWSNYSDRRLKENIVYSNNLGLNFITRLKPASYNYIQDNNKRRRDGLIAQDVEKTLKELGLDFSGLVIDDDKDKTENLSYSEFVIPLITAVQELNQKNQSLEIVVQEMKTEIEKLKQQIQSK